MSVKPDELYPCHFEAPGSVSPELSYAETGDTVTIVTEHDVPTADGATRELGFVSVTKFGITNPA